MLTRNADWGPVGFIVTDEVPAIPLSLRAETIVSSHPQKELTRFTHLIVPRAMLEASEIDAIQQVDIKLLNELKAQSHIATIGEYQVFEARRPIESFPRTNVPSVFGSNLLASKAKALVQTADGADMPSLSLCCHAMLLFGMGPTCLSQLPTGEQALRVLTDEELAASAFGSSPFVETRYGLRYRLARSDADGRHRWSESHRDQCLSTLAAMRVPLTLPIRLRAKQMSVQDLLNESVAGFSFEQAEVCWTAIAYAHYVPPRSRWADRFGQEYTFDQLIHHLVTTDLKRQSCGGLHVVHAVVQILAADARNAILSSGARQQGKRFVSDIVQSAVQSQGIDGSWDSDWHGMSKIRHGTFGSFLITGHMLDMLAHIDQNFPEQSTELAQQWLLHHLFRHPSDEVKNLNICPLTHCLRGLQSCDVHDP